MFTKAIVRLPASNFADGLTTAEGLGVPSYEKTLEQHKRYCEALQKCGLKLTHLDADSRYPDSTFVEDTAILTEHGAILTRPGAESRAGEVESMKATLAQFYPQLAEITAPGTLDGGDICEADNPGELSRTVPVSFREGKHFIIGISLRTNETGAQQLRQWLAKQGYTSAFVDIRETPGILHLKSGITYLGDNRMVVIDSLVHDKAFKGYELVRVQVGEEYAANCVRVNDYVLLATGFPVLEATLHKLGYSIIALNMSEYRKMDGGLSCLSLRF